MRVMAIDYGDARTGIAISDPTGFLAGYTTVIHGRKGEEVAEKVAQLVRERGVEKLVLGFPKNMDGTDSQRARRYRDFAGLLEQRTGLAPVLWDERLTTVEAHAILYERGKHLKEHKKNVDAVSASLILEGYLTLQRQRG